MRQGSRLTVVEDRRALGQATAIFLVVAGDGMLLRPLGAPSWLTVVYVALGAALAVGRVVLPRHWAGKRSRWRPEPLYAASAEETEAPAGAAEPDAPAYTPVRRALGYVCVTRDGASSELAAYSKEISAWAAENGVVLTSIQHDVEPETGVAGNRPALRGALERIGAGDADTLVTRSLGHLSPMVAKLPPLLRLFTSSSRTLVALDLRLDTATEAGRLAAFALSDIGDWERERLSARTRRGLEAARAKGSGTGAPSVADRPELHERIAQMREQGMTLQAIADALNEAGVPTLRGGAKWRPSSVQRATGYRRPPSQPNPNPSE